MRIFIFPFGILFFLSLGCASIGNFFVPPHSKSDFVDPERTCLFVEAETRPAEAAFVGVAASAAVGFLVDQIVKGIEKESTRYKASYSAKEMSNFYNSSGVRNNVLRLVRYQGKELLVDRPKRADSNLDLPKRKKNCEEIKADQSAVEKLKASELVIKIDRDEAHQAYRLKPDKLTLKKTKAKVRELKWLVPWSWWMALDPKEGKVDLNSKVVLSALSSSKDGVKTVDLIAADLPLGKFNLGKDIEEILIDDVMSDWFFIPNHNPKDPTFGNQPIIARVTLEESDDFGDVIGKVAEAVADRKKDIVNVIIDSSGIGGGAAAAK